MIMLQLLSLFHYFPTAIPDLKLFFQVDRHVSLSRYFVKLSSCFHLFTKTILLIS